MNCRIQKVLTTHSRGFKRICGVTKVFNQTFVHSTHIICGEIRHRPVMSDYLPPEWSGGGSLRRWLSG
jgi:hypothetical protein